MTAGQPWSVKGIDPKAREAARDLARRSGMTLGEWLAQVIQDDPVPEPSFAQPAPEIAPQALSSEPAPTPPPVYTPLILETPAPTAPIYHRAEAAGDSRDDILRFSEALDQMASRVETAEAHTAQMVGGVERTVSALVSRLDGAEQETTASATRLEGLADEIRADQGRLTEQMQRIEQQLAEPGSAEALHTLEGAIANVAQRLYDSETETRETLAGLRGELDGVSTRLEKQPEENVALIEAVVSRIAERLEQAEARTTSAIEGLEASFSQLDNRLATTETTLEAKAGNVTLEAIAAKLSADVEAARLEMSEKIQAAAEGRLDRVERALEEISTHVNVAERRSSDAVERMGHEVLRLADAFGRRVQDVERRSATAIEQVGGDVARIADTMEARLNRADTVGAQALEKLGDEIARITERLAERIGNAERRSAQAIDDVGEQVARVTDRLQERQERAATDLADRIRLSEERTVRLLEDARLRLDQRLEETERKVQASSIFAAHAAEPEPTTAIYAEPEPIAAFHAEPEEEGPFAHPRDESEEALAFDALEDEAPALIEPAFETPHFKISNFTTQAFTARTFSETPEVFASEHPSPYEARFESETPTPAPTAYAAPLYESEAAAEPEALELGAAEAHPLETEHAEPTLAEAEPEDVTEPGPLVFHTHAFEDAERIAETLDEDPFLDERFEEGRTEAAAAEDRPADEPYRSDEREIADSEGFSPDAFSQGAFSPRAFASDVFSARRFTAERFEPDGEREHAEFEAQRDEFEPEEHRLEIPRIEDEPFKLEAFRNETFARDTDEEDSFESQIPHSASASFDDEAPPEPAEVVETYEGRFEDPDFHHRPLAVEPGVGERPVEASFETPLPFGQAAEGEPAGLHRAMTTRELIEQARAAARAAALAADPKARKAAKGGGISFPGFGSKKAKRNNPSSLAAALMISGGAAALGVGAAGYVVLAGHPSGLLPPRVMAALGLPGSATPHAVPMAAPTGSADPMAAVALSPQPADNGDAAQPTPAPAAGDSGAELYGDAVRRIEARDFSGLDGLRKSANLGYAPAQFYLAKLYETGEAGLKKDLGEARRWTERAAEAGDKKAMHNLALYYVEGSGGPKNTTTAAQWFHRAADLGLVDSQYNLGRLYEEGFGVAQNPAEAYKWYLIAAHAGDAESRASAQRLKGQLSPEAQSAAERAAGAFQAQGPHPAAATQLAEASSPTDVAGAAIAQRALSRLGYYQGPTDGSPSPALKGAIAAYQRDQGLPATGVPDAALSQRLAVIAQ